MDTGALEINQSKNIKTYQVHLIILLVWFLFPIASTIPICILLYYVRLNDLTFKYYLFLLALVPAVINYTKVPISDLSSYYSEFKIFNDNGLSSVSEHSLLDPFFYYVTFFLAKCSNGYTPIFSLFWSTFIYYTLFISLFEFNKLFRPYEKKALIAVVFISAFVGIEFGLADHLVRQYAALSLAMLGIAKLCLGQKSNRIYFVLAFFTHFSTIIFLPLLIFPSLKKQTNIVLIITLGLIFYAIGSSNLLTIFGGNSRLALLGSVAEKAEIYASLDAGNITVRRWVEEGLYFAICIYFFFKPKSTFMNGEKINKFVVIFIFFSIYMLLIRNNDLLLLRYFFYFYFLSTFALLIFLKYKNYFCLLLMTFLICTTPVRFFTTMKNSDFTYIDNSYNLLLISVPQFLMN